jgi:hypothetical protein
MLRMKTCFLLHIRYVDPPSSKHLVYFSMDAAIESARSLCNAYNFIWSDAIESCLREGSADGYVLGGALTLVIEQGEIEDEPPLADESDDADAV